ncbi:MAG TPA: winged helix DNA-binding domain-containing protein [Thermoleophilaceae bacterium]
MHPLHIVTNGERLRAQLLSGPPAPDPAAVAERLLAVQAQDARGFRLAVRARTRGLTAADVDRALGDGSLVVNWLCRGTLHLVRAEDHGWLHALTAPRQLHATTRRLGQEGVDEAAAERGVAAVERALADEGPLARERLRDRIAAAGVRTEGQALVHVLALASLRGVAVRGPMIEGKHAYALVRDWIGEAGRAPAGGSARRRPPLDRDASLAELARRYLAGHAPASDRDLARWAGLPLRDARAGLAAIAPSIHEREDGLLELTGGAAPEDAPPPRLLGAFDPVLLGWTSREWIVGEHDARVASGGIFRALALAEGRAAATWSLNRGEVGLDPFGDLDPAAARAIEEEAADVRRFLGIGRMAPPDRG